MGWPFTDEHATETQKTFYPTTYLVTGHDIIFFWVARMIMMGLEFKKDVPFRTVYIHGLVRDSQGRKMSKSLGNSVDPIEMIDKYGADALRFSFLAHLFSGKDFKFSEQRLEGYRNFMNKIWNATRFTLQNLRDFNPPAEGLKALPQKVHVSVFDQWIIKKLSKTVATVNESLEKERFSDAALALYHFIWNDFCDWYIEFTKPILAGADGPDRKACQLVLAQVLNRIIRLIHPFCPFISEEIYAYLPIRSKACVIDQYPTELNDRELLQLGQREAEVEVDLIKEIISSIRNIRGENRISPAQKMKIRLGINDDRTQKILSANRTAIETMGRLETCQIGQEGDLTKCAVETVIVEDMKVRVVIPLEGLVDFNEEIKRIQKTIEKLEKDVLLLTNKLGNEKFLQNADEDVVAQDRVLLAKSKQQIQSMKESLSRFA